MSKPTKTQSVSEKAFSMMFHTLLIFAIPAVLGFLGGRALDQHFAIKPYGSLLVLACTFVFSWTVVIRMYLKFDRERREQEAAAKEHTVAAQAQLQEDLRKK